MKPQDLKFVNPGQRVKFSAAERNVLIQAAKRDSNFRRGQTNQSNQLASKDVESVDRWQYVTAAETIPPHSVFTLESLPGYYRFCPVAKTKQVDADGFNVLLTNEDWGYATGKEYYSAIIGGEEPKLVGFTPQGGIPKAGDIVGPVPNSYDVSKEYEGLVCVSDADEEKNQVWVVRHTPVGTEIEMFEFVETLHVGKTAKARKLEWDPTNTMYVTAGPTEYILFDPEEQNFFMIKERVHAIYKPLFDYMGQKFSDYEIIGEHGLRRTALTAEAIDCGDYGPAQMQYYTPEARAHPPKTEVGEIPTCEFVASDTFVNSCNRRGYRRNLMPGEVAGLHYDHGRQTWVFEQIDRPMFAEATLGDNLCPEDEDVPVTNWNLLDWFEDGCSEQPDPIPPTVKNSKRLAAFSNQKVFLVRDEGSGAKPTEDDWHIFQVEHQKFSFVAELELQGECGLEARWDVLEIAMQTCENPQSRSGGFTGITTRVLSDVRRNAQECGMDLEFTDVCVLQVYGTQTQTLQLEETPVIDGMEWESGTDPQDPTCRLLLKRSLVCGFGSRSEDDLVFDFASYLQVGTGIAESGNCVELTKTNIPIPACNTHPGDPETILCVIDCPDPESGVESEASTPGTYTPPVNSTQPYDSSSVNDGDIVIQFPNNAVEGDHLRVVNNSNGDASVTLDGNGNKVQYMETNVVADTATFRGAGAAATYQLRAIGGLFEWRIV